MKTLQRVNRTTILYLLSFLPYLITFFSHLFNENVRFANRSWQVTEVLINYEGGFVRRGLIGEIIFFLYKKFGIDVSLTVHLFCIVVCVSFMVIIIRSTIKRGFSILFLPTVFFFSSLFVSQYWVRKDFFIMLLFYFIIKIYVEHNSWKKYVAINILLSIGILSHEVLFFIVVPFLVIRQIKYDGKSCKSVFSVFLKIAPSIVTMILCAVNKGNVQQAMKIWDSWGSVMNGKMGGAIDAIGWTSAHAISRGLEVWSTVRLGFVYYPIMWALLACFAASVFIWMGNFKNPILGYTPFKKYNLSESAYILIFQFVGMLPIAIVFADYSRFFFYVLFSSYIIRLLEGENIYLAVFGKVPLKAKLFGDKCNAWITSHTKTFIFLAFLIGLPSIDVSALEHVVLHGQIGFFFMAIIELFQ
jgi:hypothetical protein